MKRILTILSLAVLVVGGLTVPAFAGNEGTVTVTADIAQVSVSVFPDSVSYGLVPMNTTNLTPIGDPWIWGGNTGNCFVDLFIKGADTTNWALDTEEPIQAGPDLYVHYFASPFYTPLGVDYQDLGGFDSYAPGFGQYFKLQMDTPITSTHVETQSTTVTVMATYKDEGIWTTINANGPYIENVSTTLTVTANVTDQNGNPVLGLSGNFFFHVYSFTPPTWMEVPGLTASVVENEGGTYTCSITDISTLPDGQYWVTILVNEGSHFGGGGDNFDINPSP
jgi:hypothetical protein